MRAKDDRIKRKEDVIKLSILQRENNITPAMLEFFLNKSVKQYLQTYSTPNDMKTCVSYEKYMEIKDMAHSLILIQDFIKDFKSKYPTLALEPFVENGVRHMKRNITIYEEINNG